MHLQDMTHLVWSKNPSGTLGTGGVYYKAICGNKYYKMSNYDAYEKSVIGYESVYEAIVTDLLEYMGIECLHYDLLYAKICVEDVTIDTYITESMEFKQNNEVKTTAENFYNAMRETKSEDPLTCFRRLGYEDYTNSLMLVDYLIINRDRHGANIEYLSSSDGSRIAPLFDNGISLLAPYNNNERAVEVFDVSRAVEANNFFGSKNLERNLDLITKPVRVRKLTESIIDSILFKYDSILPPLYIAKIKETLLWRYTYVKNKNLLLEE